MDLYRFYNPTGELLYIGISLSAAQRASQHRSQQTWWPQVARMDIEHLDVDRKAAETLERAAIVAEQPRYNVVHNGKRRHLPGVWVCDNCVRPYTDGYIQHAYDEWVSTCKTCDEGGERYFIDVSRIADERQVGEWSYHLSGKLWFDVEDWQALIHRACRIPNKTELMLDGLAARRQGGRPWWRNDT